MAEKTPRHPPSIIYQLFYHMFTLTLIYVLFALVKTDNVNNVTEKAMEHTFGHFWQLVA